MVSLFFSRAARTCTINGERRRFAMRRLLAQKPWNRIAGAGLFAGVRVDSGTVVGPVEIDIPPETLDNDSVPLD